jgi:serine/threonine-protein kinase RsbW
LTQPSRTPEPATLELPADVAHLGTFIAFAMDTARACGVSEEHFDKLELALEEMLLNIMRHGYPGQQPGPILVTCGPDADGRVAIEIRDSGIGFNPLEAAAPVLSDKLEDRPVGGLGVYLVLQIVRQPSYQRVGGQNVFSFSFPL